MLAPSLHARAGDRPDGGVAIDLAPRWRGAPRRNRPRSAPGTPRRASSRPTPAERGSPRRRGRPRRGRYAPMAQICLASPGDSGSLVVTEDGPHAVGVVLAVSQGTSGDYGIILPIDHGLNMFGGLHREGQPASVAGRSCPRSWRAARPPAHLVRQALQLPGSRAMTTSSWPSDRSTSTQRGAATSPRAQGAGDRLGASAGSSDIEGSALHQTMVVVPERLPRRQPATGVRTQEKRSRGNQRVRSAEGMDGPVTSNVKRGVERGACSYSCLLNGAPPDTCTERVAERVTSTVGGGLLRLPGRDLSDGPVEARLRSRPRAQRRAAPRRDPWPGPGIELAYVISISSWQ